MSPDQNEASIQLQPRDIELLRGLFESRVMTLAHAVTLYFGGKREMAKKRVQKLKAAGIIRERPRQFSDPSVLFLTHSAFRLLRDRGELADYPRISLPDLDKRARVSELTLRHELEVMDVKAAMVTAINELEQLTVVKFSTWPALHSFRACRPQGERVTVKPDGFIRVRETEADDSVSEHTFFLEVDRSTETLDVLCQRCHCYLDYYRSGGFALFNGQRREDYREFPFRVLVVCKSGKRRDNVAFRLLRNNPPIATQVWVTTIAQVKTDMPGNIWLIPATLRKVAALHDGHAFELSDRAITNTRLCGLFNEPPIAG